MNKLLKNLIDKTIYIPKEDEMMVEGFIIESPYDYSGDKKILKWFIREDLSKEQYVELAKEYYNKTGSLINICSRNIKTASYANISDGTSFYHTDFPIPFIAVIGVEIDDSEHQRYLASEYYYNFLFDNDENNIIMKLSYGYDVDIKLSFEKFLEDMGRINSYISMVKFKPNYNSKGKSKLKIYLSKSTKQNIHDKVTSSLYYHELLYAEMLKHDVTEKGITITIKIPKIFSPDYIRECIRQKLGKERISRPELYM